VFERETVNSQTHAKGIGDNGQKRTPPLRSGVEAEYMFFNDQLLLV
jgi:hypothetical protein